MAGPVICASKRNRPLHLFADEEPERREHRDAPVRDLDVRVPLRLGLLDVVEEAEQVDAVGEGGHPGRARRSRRWQGVELPAGGHAGGGARLRARLRRRGRRAAAAAALGGTATRVEGAVEGGRALGTPCRWRLGEESGE